MPPGDSRDLNLHYMSLTLEHGKPVFPPDLARKIARSVDGYAGKGGVQIWHGGIEFVNFNALRTRNSFDAGYC